MGQEQSSTTNKAHFVYVREERASEERQEETQRKIDAAVEQQKKHYEARLRLLQAEAAKVKKAAQAQAAEAKAAEARAAAQAQALQAQAAQILQAQAAQVGQVQASQFQAVQILQAQTGQTHVPVVTPSSGNSTNFERSRNPYSLCGEDLHRNINFPAPNLYPNLNSPSTSGAFNRLSGAQTNTQGPNPFINGSNREARNDFVFVNSAVPSAPERDSSVSSSRGRKNEDDDIRCPTCKDIYGARIYQCRRGHSSCENCKLRKALCGKCGETIIDMRNITLEDYVAEREIPCPNSADGCRRFIKNKGLDSHLKECPFGVIACPLNPRYKICTWKGKMSQLSSHFKDVHPGFHQADVDTEMMLINICNDQDYLQFLTIGNFNFLLHVKIFQQQCKICMAVQLIGTQKSALKWNYEVNVYNKREPRRKYQFSDSCTSSTVPINDIFKESKCVELPFPYALTFYNEGCLTYKVFIKKNNDGTERTNFVGNRRGRGRGGAYRKI